MAFGFNLGDLFGGGPGPGQELNNNGWQANLPVVPAAAQSINTTAAQPYTNAQASLLAQLGQQAQGLGGPTQAQQNLQSGLTQTLANQKAALAGARGNNQNLGLEGAQVANATAAANASTAGNAAALRAQEQANAQSQYGNLATTAAGQQQQVAETNANLANSQWQMNAQNTEAYNNAVAGITGAQNQGNQQFATDLFIPNIGAGSSSSDENVKNNISDVSDDEMSNWMSHVGSIINQPESGVSPGASPNAPGISLPGVDWNAGKTQERSKNQMPNIPDSGTPDTPDAQKAGSNSVFDDQSGGMAGGQGPAYYQSPTESAPAVPATDADIAGNAGGAALPSAGADLTSGAAADAGIDAAATDAAATSLVSDAALLAAAHGVVIDPGTIFSNMWGSSSPNAHKMDDNTQDLDQPEEIPENEAPASVDARSGGRNVPSAQANGRVLKGPKVVLAGEAGPEAIVPLKKDGSPDEAKATGPGMDKFFEALKAHQYKYDNPDAPGSAPGTHFGPMAQELEKTGPIGKSVVEEGPDGVKRINTGRLALALAGAGAAQENRISNLESALNALAKKKGKK